MDLSGMIFVALAVVWAVYLIPRAVNRSEDELALAAPEPVHEASGEGAQSAESAESADDRSAGATPEAVPAPVAAATAAPSPAPGRSGPVVGRGTGTPAVVRRRRVLLTLLAVTGLVAVAAAVAVLPVWAVAVPAVAALSWLVVCRVQVRRLQAARHVRSRVADRTAPPAHAPAPARDVPEVVPAPAHPVVARVAPQHGEVAGSPAEESVPVAPAPVAPVTPAALVVEADEDTVGLDETDRAAAVAEEMPRGAVWDPRPLTLPTYISKPRARRVPRTIALDADGVSSSGRDARDSRLVAEGAAAGVEATARPREAVGS